MDKEIYEALKKRIGPASDYQVTVYYEDYPLTDRGLPIYQIDLEGIDEDIPAIVQAMCTKNIWNVAQRFYSTLRQIFDDVDVRLLSGRHVSCK